MDEWKRFERRSFGERAFVGTPLNAVKVDASDLEAFAFYVFDFEADVLSQYET